ADQLVGEWPRQGQRHVAQRAQRPPCSVRQPVLPGNLRPAAPSRGARMPPLPPSSFSLTGRAIPFSWTCRCRSGWKGARGKRGRTGAARGGPAIDPARTLVSGGGGVVQG